MSCAITRWLRQDGIVQVAAANTGATLALVAGPDPMRYVAILEADDTTETIYQFGDGNPGNRQIWIPTNGPSIIVTEDDLGAIIKLPLWSSHFTGTRTSIATMASYNPAKWSQYERIIKKHLSQW